MGKFGKKRGGKSSTTKKVSRGSLGTRGFGEEMIKEMFVERLITTDSSSSFVENDSNVREMTQVTEWTLVDKDDGYDDDDDDEEEVNILKRPKSATLTVPSVTKRRNPKIPPPIFIPPNSKKKNVVIELSGTANSKRKRSLSVPRGLRMSFSQSMDVKSPLNVIKSDQVMMDGLPLKYSIIDDSDIGAVTTNETDNFVERMPYDHLIHDDNI